MATRKKDFPCIKCSNHVKKNDKAVQCSLCELWIHKACEDMDDDTFDVLVRQVSQNGETFWACRSCRRYAAKFDKSVKELDRKVQGILSRLDKHDEEFATMKSAITKLEDGNASTAANIDPAVIQSNASSVVFCEMGERDKRKVNVIVHGLPEPARDIIDGKLRMDKDIETLQDLVSQIDVEMTMTDAVQFARRLGECSDDASHPRPLLVGFRDVGCKNQVLDNSRKLAVKEDHWKDVNIVQDLTKLQRNEEKKMREQALELNSKLSSEDSKNWIHKVVGKRGERRVMKLHKKPEVAEAPTVAPRRTTKSHGEVNVLGNDSASYKVLYGNVRSVVNKIDELKCMVTDLKPDIICIAESWTNKSHSDAYLKIQGFNIVCRHERKDTTAGIGGGLLIYVKDGIGAAESFLPIFSDFNQCCSVKLPTAKNKFIELVLVYRPHRLYNSNTDLETNNQHLCDIIANVPKPSILIGDFNCSDISWELCHSEATSRPLLESVLDNFFNQHVDFPTHISGTTPDIVLSSDSNLINGVEDVGKLGSSDHSMLMVDIVGKLPSNESLEEVPDWRNANMTDLVNDLADVDWNAELGNLGTEASWTKFKLTLDAIQAKHVPLKKRRMKNKPIWMNKNVMRVIRKKRRLWKVYTQTRDYSEYVAYKQVEKCVQKTVRRAKRNFERKLAKDIKKRPKDFYSYIRSNIANRVSIGPLKDGKELIGDTEKMAELLNTHFSSVFTKEDIDSLPTPNMIYTGSAPLSTVDFPPSLVQDKLNQLDVTSAPGPDKMYPKLLKAVSESIALPLSLIYARSLNEGIVPTDWKLANVTPIFKKGSKGDAGNYRPVSLTAVVCKVMESILKDSVMQHLINNSILNDTQHGFMQGRSCLTNLLEYLEVLTKLVDEGHSVDVVYLDFSKAFDTVPHARLVEKLKSAGISGNILNWISDWLNGRSQRVVLNGKSSGWTSVLSGVPQGSVFGPVLFLIYINDIDNAVDTVFSVLFKFADDTKILRVVNNDDDRAKLQLDIDNLFNWSLEWQMMFNVKKCKVIHFGRKNFRSNYTIGGYAPAGSVLENVTEEKDLGVFIHKSLKPSYHCAKVAIKANQVLGQMARTFTYRDKYSWVRLYKRYVRPHLEYAIQSWCPWTQADKDLLESVQIRAVRMISGLEGSYQDRLKAIGLLSLESRRLRGDMIQVWKFMNNKQSVDRKKLFTTLEESCIRQSRQTGSPLALTKPHFNSDVRKNFFTIRVVDQWNTLPASLRLAKTIDEFKAGYDSL